MGEAVPHPISPLEGEMPGRAEGGSEATSSNDKNTEYTLTSPDSFR